MFNYNQETIYSLLCAVLPCFIYLLVWGRKKPLLHSVWVMIFVLYCWQVYDITGAGGLSDILYRPEGSINPSFIQGTVNLIPFQNFTTGFFLNILMCVPLGFMLPFVWKAYRKFRVTVLSGAGFSALIEVSQLLTTRATDIDDLIANTLGTAVGFAVWFAFAKLFGQRMKTTVDGSKEAWIYIAKFLWHVLSPLSILVCIQGCTAHLALKIGGKYNEKNCDYFRRSFHRI